MERIAATWNRAALIQKVTAVCLTIFRSACGCCFDENSWVAPLTPDF